MSSDEAVLFCDRCLTPLKPGEGVFYVIKIEAAADPTPPPVTPAELSKDFKQEIETLLAEMEEMSERELMDQVYRRLTLYLCGPCYRHWIENPLGEG